MIAFFSVFAYLFVILLMWKGHEIRAASPFMSSSSEEGTTILQHYGHEETAIKSRTVCYLKTVQ